MTPRFLTSLSRHGFHRVAYYEWGDPANMQVAICVHGLTRNGRDFDELARALSATHRVLAIDMPGRGASEWLRDPMEYAFPTYLTTLTALIARSGADRVDWIGTSMGGLLGLVVAAQPNTPVRRLVINDVGPSIEPAALERLQQYVGADPTFATYEEIEQYVRTISAPFGKLTDAQWAHLARTSARQRADGRWGLTYDPAIAAPFRANPAPADLWQVWDAIRCPTLLLRGRDSDLLSSQTAREMTRRGPKPALIEFADVGHAPAMLDLEQIRPVVDFLR